MILGIPHCIRYSESVVGGCQQRAALKGVTVYESGDSMGKIAWSNYQRLGREMLAKNGKSVFDGLLAADRAEEEVKPEVSSLEN